MRTYENKKNLKKWDPDWQDGEYWTVINIGPFLKDLNKTYLFLKKNGFDLKKEPGLLNSFLTSNYWQHKKCYRPGEDIFSCYYNIKYTVNKSEKIKISTIHDKKEKYMKFKTLILDFKKDFSFSMKVFFNRYDYKVNRYYIKINNKWEFLYIGKVYPANYPDKFPFMVPTFPINLKQKLSKKILTTYRYTRKISEEDKKRINKLYEKSNALYSIQSYYRHPHEKIKKLKTKYPELSNLTTKEASKIHFEIWDEIDKIENKYTPLKVKDKIFIREIQIIDFEELKENISSTKFNTVIKMCETKNYPYKKEEKIEFDKVKKQIINNLIEYEKKAGLGHIFLINFYIKENPKTAKEIYLSQIWSTQFNWPIITKVYCDNEELASLSFLKLK